MSDLASKHCFEIDEAMDGADPRVKELYCGYSENQLSENLFFSRKKQKGLLLCGRRRRRR
jgi:hypothetical protein